MLQKRLWLLLILVFGLMLAALVAGSGPAAAAVNGTIPHREIPTFEPSPCMFEFEYAFVSVEEANIECGYLVVPERHSDPDGPTIRLAVAILKSSSLDPAPDPLVMAQGGPGGSTIEFAQVLINSPLRADRDIILFDQRGTLYSEPNLFCPEVITYTADSIERQLTLEEDLELSSEALLACRQRLTEEGVNLAAFNSLENAADIDALRVALGYEQINLYGISYGTLLAFHTMRDHPAGLRSVILDAVVPPQKNFLLEISGTINRAFSELFKACTADVVCRADYPNLEQRFFDLVAELNEQPITVPLTDPETKEHYEAVLDGDDFIDVVFQYLYQTEFIPILPKLIDDVSRGNYTFLSNTLPLFLFDRTFSMGMYQSVICAEDADFRIEDMRTTGIRPQFVNGAEAQNEALLRLCAEWDVPALGPSVDEPVASDIPTLLLSGQFDPITPPSFAEAAARTLTRSYSYTFLVNGHGAAVPGNFCTNRIIGTFLNNPMVEPDASCIDELPALPLFLPASTLTVGLVGSLATAPNTTHLIQFTLLGVSVLGLLSAWVVWPVMMVIHWLRHRSLPRRPWPAWLAYLWGILAGLLSMLFIVALAGVVIFTVADSQNLSLLLVGLPGEAAPLFVLPPLFILLTAAMLLAALMAWIGRYGSLFERIYYILLTLFAVVYSGILIQWGMVTVLL